MTTRIIETEADLRGLHTFLAAQKMPFTVNVTKGKNRSLQQNRLQRLLIDEITEQLPDRDKEDWRAYCKLHLGVPILRSECEAFREAYDARVRPLSYEDKIAFMRVPLDFPVTRLMTTKQHAQYLEAIYHHFCEQGLQLTEPQK